MLLNCACELAGADAVGRIAHMPFSTAELRGLLGYLSGLVLADAFAEAVAEIVLSCGGLGEIGTFHKLASSGKSSSES